MNILQRYEDNAWLDAQLEVYSQEHTLYENPLAPTLVAAHMDKAKHNLKFVGTNLKDQEFNDWTIVGLYYAAYHAALALVSKKGHTSKSHEATLVFIIRKYRISKDDAELLQEMAVTKEDAAFYAGLMEKRLQANYSTNTLFSQEKIAEYRKRTIEFINKVQEMLESQSQ